MDKARILVVENESIVAMDIKASLLNLGYTVLGMATTGAEAIEKAVQTKPDLILMDIKLKGDMDGVQAAGQIRTKLDIPLIYLTAFTDECTVERAKITQPYGYLLKPFGESDLQTSIEMALYKHRMEQKVKVSERWLSTTLQSIGDAVIATDAHCLVKFMNPVAETLTGWQQTEALGLSVQQVFNIINAQTGQPYPSPVEGALHTGQVCYLEEDTELVTRSGQQIPVDDSAAPIKDDLGHIQGAVLVFRDITGRKKAEEELHRYARELKTRNQELDAFAHTVAHDIQSPLAPLIGTAEILVRDYESMSPEQLGPYLHSILRSGRKVANIVDELLLLAQVHRTDIKTRPLGMSEILKEAVYRLSPMVDEYQAEIIYPVEWPEAVGYGPWIEEVWVNYLSNAIKYGGTPPRLVLGATRQNNNMISYWVRDNGPGLSSEAQNRLFLPFTRLEQARAKGHGLGLSIVRWIVEKLNGQVGVHSSPEDGGGSIFWFTLPAAVKR